jgi:hypothetical protein
LIHKEIAIIPKKRSQKDIEERAKSDAIFSLWDKDGNLLVSNGMVTEKGKKRL